MHRHQNYLTVVRGDKWMLCGLDSITPTKSKRSLKRSMTAWVNAHTIARVRGGGFRCPPEMRNDRAPDS